MIVLQNLSTNSKYYQWTIDGKGNTTDTSPEISYSKAGQYNVKLFAFYNDLCKDSFEWSQPITIFKKPYPDFSYETGYNDGIIGEVQFKNLSTQSTSQLWDFGDGFTSKDLNPMHEYNINRDITVVLTAYNNNEGLYTCTDSIAKEIAPEWITTFFAPSVLAPEYGDGLVKVFKPVGIGIKKYKMTIYSPWGEAVWSSEKIDDNGSPVESWDGRYKGEIVPQGAYTWRVDLEWVNDIPFVKTGSVTVVR